MENSIRRRKRILHCPDTFDRSTSGNNSDDSFSTVNNNSQQRSVYARKKPESLTCSICYGLAHGYNFDVITCESCKAFFRRNALKANELIKCQLSNGYCVITESTRKRCKACRLAKCFEKGMRADWILTDEERTSKRQKIEENRRLRQILYPDPLETEEIQTIQTKTESYDENTMVPSLPTTSSVLLSSTDLVKIQQIEQAYTDSVRLTSLSSEFPSYPQSFQITQVSDLFNFLTNLLVTRLITYFKFLPEFSSLNGHDKLLLIKYNTFTLSFIRAVLNYNPLTDTYHEPNTNECIFNGHDILQCSSSHQYNRSRKCIQNLLNTSLNDRFILKVLLIIMVFSKGSSIATDSDEMEPIANDIRSIYQAQNVFVDLLWRYCENKFGLYVTVQTWLKLTTYSMDAHLQAYDARHGDLSKNTRTNQLLPLIKSILLVMEK